MSAMAIEETLDMVDIDHPNMTDEQRAKVAQAKAEWEAIKKAAAALVDWNTRGRPAFHLDAARGYDVLKRIAKETQE